MGERGSSVLSYYDSSAFIEDLANIPPAVVLLDLVMPGRDGLSVQKEIVRSGLPLSVVFLSGAGQLPDAVEAMRHGAVDFLGKPFRRDALYAALARAETNLAQLATERDRRNRLQVLSRLSPREVEVLQAIAAGLQTKTIAYQLDISCRTVEMHRGNITTKLGAPLTGALLLAQEAGLLKTAA